MAEKLSTLRDEDVEVFPAKFYKSLAARLAAAEKTIKELKDGLTELVQKLTKAGYVK